MRGFVLENTEYDENDEETLKSQIRREMVEKLAAEWNETHQEIERQSWRDQDDLDNEADYHACQVEDIVWSAKDQAKQKNPNLTKEELHAIGQKAQDDYYKEVEKKRRIKHERLEVVEELLGELGARMMRPYEHWNEDEKYMEYMENRYDNDY